MYSPCKRRAAIFLDKAVGIIIKLFQNVPVWNKELLVPQYDNDISLSNITQSAPVLLSLSCANHNDRISTANNVDRSMYSLPKPATFF